jgi:uncharacterized iron-regulated membrane protein
MKGPLRRTMIWLHTWSSILLGWLLFAIFLTGTLSYFRAEISHWMTPERHGSYLTQESLVTAYTRLKEIAPDATRWDISLPSARNNTVSLNWQEEGVNERRRGPKEVLNAATGEPIDERETRGGDFLYRFHFELYGLPRGFSRTLVEIATMCMFIALISGVIMHRKIFSDFFSFRTQKRSLGWGDAHAVTAVLALPFHVMITFSGLLLLSSSLIFWTENTRGGGGERAPQANQANQMAQGGRERGANPPMTNQETRERPTEARENRPTREQNGARANNRVGAETHREKPSNPHREARDLSTPPLQAMLQNAQTQLDARIERIQIHQPLQKGASFVFTSSERDVLLAERGSSDSVTFSANGEITGQEALKTSDSSFFTAASGVFRTLHEARFADSIVRWCFFISGVMGTLMVGTGSILWASKRAKKQMGRVGFELVNTLNIASITGLCGAVAVYFWLNRLLPADFASRQDWEINGFFIAWLVALVHALFFRNRGAWLHQLFVCGALFMALPVLDQLTSPVGLWHAVSHADALRLSFDGMCLLLGVLFFTGAIYIRKKQAIKATSPQRRAPKSFKKEGVAV